MNEDQHAHTVFVGGGNDFLVTDGTPRLDDGGDA